MKDLLLKHSVKIETAFVIIFLLLSAVELIHKNYWGAWNNFYASLLWIIITARGKLLIGYRNICGDQQQLLNEIVEAYKQNKQ